MNSSRTPRERIAELLQDLNDRCQEYNAGLWAWDGANAAGKSDLWTALVNKKDEIGRLLREIEQLAAGLNQ